jgi:membrane protease YdiL (CAAX protease family)
MHDVEPTSTPLSTTWPIPAPATESVLSRVRRAITERPALQPLAFVAALGVFIWGVQPYGSDAGRMLGWAVLTLIPIASSILHRDNPWDLGLRFDNLLGSGRDGLIATAAGSCLIVLVSAGAGWESKVTARSLFTVTGYLFWALSQQYVLQGFVYRRLKESPMHPGLAPVVAALLFGVVHLPNPILAPATALAGYVWCRLYDRSPNLFTLTLSHALLATMLMNHVPVELHVMRVGPGYWAP